MGMTHVSEAKKLRRALDQEGWFTISRPSSFATALHLRTSTGSEPVCVLVSEGLVFSVLVGKPTVNPKIETFRDRDEVISHLRDVAEWTTDQIQESQPVRGLFRRKGAALPDDATLKLGHELDNGARVLHHTPGKDGKAGHVFAILDGGFLVWRVSDGPDSRIQSLEVAPYFADTFEDGWENYCNLAGIPA